MLLKRVKSKEKATGEPFNSKLGRLLSINEKKNRQVGVILSKGDAVMWEGSPARQSLPIIQFKL